MFYISEYEQEDIREKVGDITNTEVSLSHYGCSLILEINAKYLETNMFPDIEQAIGVIVTGVEAKNSKIFLYTIQDYDNLCTLVKCSAADNGKCHYGYPEKYECNKIKNYMWYKS